MADFIVVGVILILFIAAMAYIVKEKKKGHSCIGCPNASNCSKHCKSKSSKE